MHPQLRLCRSLALVLLAGCAGGATGPDDVASGTFVLRAVRPQAGAELAVPATHPIGVTADSVRVLGGSFVLEAGRWRVRTEQVVMAAGEARGRTLEESGEFAVDSDLGGRLVLDLYPGKFVTADRPWTALLAGDTVHYGYGVYVR